MAVAAYFAEEIGEHGRVLADTAAALEAPFARLVAVCAEALRGEHKLLFFGNGGSAADAQHLAAELVVRFHADRRALPALALTTDTSVLTAIGNDLGFAEAFARQIEALGQAGDVAIALTTSGQSENIIRGLTAARARGLVAAAFAGKGGGRLVGLAEPLLIVPSHTAARIQEMHIMLGQMLCGALERELGLA
ncbi:MAG: SIS domain-containing protein [Alphaproteobacteria bacterium]|nr:SIS domain-containing protein [Alphaproteobacteria bacterium]